MSTLQIKDKFSRTRLSTEDTTREAAKRRLYAKEAKYTIYVDGAHMLNAPTEQYVLSSIKFISLSIIILAFCYDENINKTIVGYIAYFNYILSCISLLVYVIMMYRRSHVDEESDLVGNITFISLKTQKEFYVFILSLQLWISIWYFYIFDTKPKKCTEEFGEGMNKFVKKKFMQYICSLTVSIQYIIISTIVVTIYQIVSFVIFKRL